MYLKQKFVYQFLSHFFVSLFLFTPIFAGRHFLFCQFLHLYSVTSVYTLLTPYFSIHEIRGIKNGKILVILHRIKLTKKLHIPYKVTKFYSTNKNFYLPIFGPIFTKMLLILPIFQNMLFLLCQFLSVLFCAFCIVIIYYL